MKARSMALAAVALVATLPTASSYAAVKQAPAVCNLVKDGAGDTTPAPVDSLDILGGDIASDAKKLTGVIRLKTLADLEPSAPLGRVFTIEFEGDGADTYSFLSYITTPSGSGASYGYYDGTTNSGQGAASFKIDTAKKEIRMTVPIGSLAKPGTGSFKVGKKISSIEVSTARWIGAYAGADVFYAGFNNPADTAAASKTYVAGSRSCVKVGG